MHDNHLRLATLFNPSLSCRLQVGADDQIIDNFFLRCCKTFKFRADDSPIASMSRFACEIISGDSRDELRYIITLNPFRIFLVH